MSWLRIDDQFATHPKILALARSDRWTWMEILCYCARHDTEGDIPAAIAEVIPKATKSFLHHCVEIGLLDATEEPGLTVHDWFIYNGQHIEDRVAAYLEQNPDSTANDVYRAIGGGRKQVLRAVRNWYERTTPSGANGGTKPGTDPVPKVVSRRARAHDTLPLPLRTTKTRDVPEGSNATGSKRAAIKPPELRKID